eukprot:COSAG02_NODE_980_length_15492_cov_12.941727_11_plen_80_part_00
MMGNRDTATGARDEALGNTLITGNISNDVRKQLVSRGGPRSLPVHFSVSSMDKCIPPQESNPACDSEGQKARACVMAAR